MNQADSSVFEDVNTDCYNPDVAGFSRVLVWISQGKSQSLEMVVAPCVKQSATDKTLQTPGVSVYYLKHFHHQHQQS